MQNQLEFREIVPFFLDCIKQLGCQESDILKQDFDIACKCPVCGDSRTRRNLKRLHLYQKGDVINVNCFNGDCSVKNMTPYRFFQDYNSRIFEQFKQFYKRRFFNEIVDSSSLKTKESETAKFDKVQDLFEVTEIQDPTRELSKTQILEMIQDFEWSYNDEQDLANFKELVTNVKKLGDQAFQDFKSLIN